MLHEKVVLRPVVGDMAWIEIEFGHQPFLVREVRLRVVEQGSVGHGQVFMIGRMAINETGGQSIDQIDQTMVLLVH